MRFTVYKNSALATLLSIFGAIFLISGIVMLFSAEIAGGLVLLALGIALTILARRHAEKVAFDKWWVEVTQQIPEAVIAQNLNYMVTLLQKCSDRTRLLQKLRALNPQLVEQIVLVCNKCGRQYPIGEKTCPHCSKK